MTTSFLTLLKEEHKEAKALLTEILDQDQIDMKKTEKVCNELLLHMEMEEKFLYPVMESFENAEEITEEAELEHAEAKKLIKEILSKDLENLERKVKIEMLKLAIEHHVKEEESDLFIKVKEDLSKEQMTDISEQIVSYKEKHQGKKLATASK